jgi:hypothetical protein
MLVHARCLIEFIAKRRRKSDIHRHDYLPGWELSELEGDEARLLFKKISKYLSHLSWKRAEVVTEEFPRWPHELPYFMVKLFEEFAAEVGNAHAGKPWVPVFQAAVQSARSALPAAPPPGEATTSGALMVPSTSDLGTEEARAMTATEGELKCKLCGETVDPDSPWVTKVRYGDDPDDLRPAPSVVFCSEKHQIEWFQRRSGAAEPDDSDDH